MSDYAKSGNSAMSERMNRAYFNILSMCSTFAVGLLTQTRDVSLWTSTHGVKPASLAHKAFSSLNMCIGGIAPNLYRVNVTKAVIGAYM